MLTCNRFSKIKCSKMNLSLTWQMLEDYQINLVNNTSTIKIIAYLKVAMLDPLKN